MQSEVGFKVIDFDPRGLMGTADVAEGLIQVVLSALILAAISPTVLRPMLRPLVGDLGVERLAIPENRERIYLAVIGSLLFGAALYLLSALVPVDSFHPEYGTTGVIRRFTEFGEAFRWSLNIAAVIAGFTLALSLVQYIADSKLGAGFGALGLVGATLSVSVVIASERPLPWIVGGFPIALVVCVLCRTVPHATWMAIRCVAYPGLAGMALVSAAYLVEGALESAGVVGKLLIENW